MALSSDRDFLIHQGYPVRVYWNGWETDTYRLNGCGWQMASHEDFQYDTMRVIFKHGDIAMEGTLRDFRRISYAMREDFGRSLGMLRGLVINIERVMNIHTTRIVSSQDSYQNMVWRDMAPSETAMSMRDYKLSELSLFRELAKPIAQELIVSPEDVQATLDLILKAQSLGMKDMRAKERRRDRDDPEVKQVHAQIISLKAA